MSQFFNAVQKRKYSVIISEHLHTIAKIIEKKQNNYFQNQISCDLFCQTENGSGSYCKTLYQETSHHWMERGNSRNCQVSKYLLQNVSGSCEVKALDNLFIPN